MVQQDRIDRLAARIAGWGAALAVLLGVSVRLANVRRSSLWLDEAYSRFAAEHGWWFLWHVVPRYETHPPFYYSLLHVWQSIAGDSLVAYRSSSLILGLATIAMVGLAARALADRMASTPPMRIMMICMATGYAALCPMLIHTSRLVRPYALMVLVYAVATLALLRLAGDAAERRPLARRRIAAYFVAEALMLWLHSLGPLFAVAMTIALLIVVARRGLPAADWGWLVAGQIGAGLLYLPAFAILLRQAPTWIQSTWLIFDWRSVPDQLSWLYSGPWRPLGIYAAIAFAGGMAQFVLLRRGYRIGAALLILTGLPVLLALLLSWLVSPVFLPRTLSPAAVPFTLGVAMLATSRRPPWGGAILVALLLVLGITYDFNKGAWAPGEDWRAASGWIAQRATPGDAIWAYPNETALPLGYALADRGHPLAIRQLPAPLPALGVPGTHPTGTPGTVALSPGEIVRLANDPTTAIPHRIWLVGLAAEWFDPDDALLATLQRDRTIGRRYHDQEIRIVELVAKPSAAMPGRAVPAAAAAAH